MPAVNVNCPACCTGCAKQCFQSFTATYSCVEESWTAPVAGAKVCLDAGTSTAWVQTSHSPISCTYQIYVPMGHCCTVDGDCSGFSVAPPDLPFGGLAPTDCCKCSEDCVSDPDLHCCDSFLSPPYVNGLTPDLVEITIGGTANNSKCIFDGDGRVWRVDISGLSGLSITLTRGGGASCVYTGEINVTGLAKMLTCTGTPGAGCAACTPTTDIIDFVKLHVEWTTGTVFPVFSLRDSMGDVDRADCSTPPLCNPGPVTFFIVQRDLTSSFSSCCDPFHGTAGGDNTSDDWNTGYITDWSIVPC
jgi:hypothetical protein